MTITGFKKKNLRKKTRLSILNIGICKDLFLHKDKVHLYIIYPEGPVMVWKEIITKIFTSEGCLKA